MRIFFLTSLAFLLFSSTAFAQTDDSDSLSTQLGKELDKVFNTKVYMDVDSTVFPTRQNNFYFNEPEQAMIMTLVAPQSFAKAEEHFDKQTKKDGYKSVEKKKFTHNGRNYLYQKGIFKKDGHKAIMYLYAIGESETETIFFTSLHMAGDEEKFFPAIERAALSASLTK